MLNLKNLFFISIAVGAMTSGLLSMAELNAANNLAAMRHSVKREVVKCTQTYNPNGDALDNSGNDDDTDGEVTEQCVSEMVGE